MKCTAKTSAGNPCKLAAITGALVCHKHGGSAPQVKRKAAVRAEVLAWGLGDVCEDPGTVLLRLVTQSAARVERYSDALQEFVGESPDLRSALVREAWGEFGVTGEFIRGLVQLEAQERDRCASMAAKAVAAGLEVRQVELAEREGLMLAEVLRAVFADQALGLSESQRRAAPAAIRRHLGVAISNDLERRPLVLDGPA